MQEAIQTHSRIRDTDTVNSVVSQTYRHQVRISLFPTLNLPIQTITY